MAKQKQKIINVGCEFEQQDVKSEYLLDFKKTTKYKILFTDGYYVNITDKTEHIDNDDEVEANLYTPDNMKKSTNWVNSRIDEVQYILYNWFMNLELKDDNVYLLSFTRGRPVGGGFL